VFGDSRERLGQERRPAFGQPASDRFVTRRLFIVTGEGKVRAVLTGVRARGTSGDALRRRGSLQLDPQLAGARIELGFSLVKFPFAGIDTGVPAIRRHVPLVCGLISGIGDELALVGFPSPALIACSSSHRASTHRYHITGEIQCEVWDR
jgi:hypothetical protein